MMPICLRLSTAGSSLGMFLTSISSFQVGYGNAALHLGEFYFPDRAKAFIPYSVLPELVFLPAPHVLLSIWVPSIS